MRSKGVCFGSGVLFVLEFKAGAAIKGGCVDEDEDDVSAETLHSSGCERVSTPVMTCRLSVCTLSPDCLLFHLAPFRKRTFCIVVF